MSILGQDPALSFLSRDCAAPVLASPDALCFLWPLLVLRDTPNNVTATSDAARQEQGYKLRRFLALSTKKVAPLVQDPDKVKGI